MIIQEVLLDYFNVFDISFDKVSAEFCSCGVVWFNSDDMIYTVSKSISDDAWACTDFYDGITFFKVGMTNQN